MRLYTIHIPDPSAGDLTPTGGAADPVPIKEGFSWPALIFSVLWGLWHRLWLVTLGIVCLNGLIAGVLFALGADAVTASAVNAGYALLLGLFGNDLRRWTLERNGMMEAAVVIGRTGDEALERYLRDRENTAEPPTSSPSPLPSTPPSTPSPPRLPRTLAAPSYTGVGR